MGKLSSPALVNNNLMFLQTGLDGKEGGYFLLDTRASQEVMSRKVAAPMHGIEMLAHPKCVVCKGSGH